MIHYKQDWLISLRILLHFNGSVVPWTFPRAMFSGFLCFLSMYFDVLDNNVRGGGVMWHPTTFVFFLQISAYILAFHTNQAYNRYWEARTQVQQMASYWGDVASQLIAFDESSDTSIEGAIWRATIIHLLSLLHAVCIKYLLHEGAVGSQLEVLGGINEGEIERLSYCDDQAYLVMHWISQEVSTKHMSGKLSIPAPILSRSWQVLSLGMLAYNQACKIEDTPFPFPYIQLLHLMDLIMTLVSPFVIASWTTNIYFAVALTMMAVGAFHAMFSAACIMETPFGRRSNDLPLIELHVDFLSRLKSIVNLDVAEKLNQMVNDDSFINAKTVEDVSLRSVDSLMLSNNPSFRCNGQENDVDTPFDSSYSPVASRKRNRFVSKIPCVRNCVVKDTSIQIQKESTEKKEVLTAIPVESKQHRRITPQPGGPSSATIGQPLPQREMSIADSRIMRQTSVSGILQNNAMVRIRKSLTPESPCKPSQSTGLLEPPSSIKPKTTSGDVEPLQSSAHDMHETVEHPLFSVLATPDFGSLKKKKDSGLGQENNIENSNIIDNYRVNDSPPFASAEREEQYVNSSNQNQEQNLTELGYDIYVGRKNKFNVNTNNNDDDFLEYRKQPSADTYPDDHEDLQKAQNIWRSDSSPFRTLHHQNSFPRSEAWQACSDSAQQCPIQHSRSVQLSSYRSPADNRNNVPNIRISTGAETIYPKSVISGQQLPITSNRRIGSDVSSLRTLGLRKAARKQG